MTRVSETDGCAHFTWNPAPAAAQTARAFAIGDTVHVRGVVEEVCLTSTLVRFDFFRMPMYVNTSKDIVAHEPRAFKTGDKVQSKDGRVGTIRYIEDDWAVVAETHRCKAIRYLIDLQRAPAQEGRAP